MNQLNSSRLKSTLLVSIIIASIEKILLKHVSTKIVGILEEEGRRGRQDVKILRC